MTIYLLARAVGALAGLWASTALGAISWDPWSLAAIALRELVTDPLRPATRMIEVLS